MSDFDKLLKLASLLGIPVTYKKGRRGDQALFIYEGSSSRIVLHKKSRKVESVLVLLHELGHALDWIWMGRPKKIPPALSMLQSKMGSKERYVIWTYERRAVANALLIDKMLQLEIPRDRLETERLFDLWISSFFYRKGKYPSLKERERRWKTTYENVKRITR